MVNIGIKMKKEDQDWHEHIERLNKVANVVQIYDDKNIGDISLIDVLIATRVTVSDIEKMPNLKAVFLYKTGTDSLPIELLFERNIEVIPSHANAEYIAEHALALALSLIHRVNEFDADLRRGIWYSDGINYFWDSLSKMNVGILGYGNIGHYLADKISPLSSKVIVKNNSGVYDNRYDIATSLEDLIYKSDILFICIPKNIETIDLINEKVLCNMKGKYIVNISRAEICNEEDLYNSLTNGILAGYASDVWYVSADKNNKLNPIKPTHFNFELLPNVILSPHCATHERDAHNRYVSDSVNNCLRYLGLE